MTPEQTKKHRAVLSSHFQKQSRPSVARPSRLEKAAEKHATPDDGSLMDGIAVADFIDGARWAYRAIRRDMLKHCIRYWISNLDDSWKRISKAGK